MLILKNLTNIKKTAFFAKKRFSKQEKCVIIPKYTYTREESAFFRVGFTGTVSDFSEEEKVNAKENQ